MARPEEILRGFVEESRHLTTSLNMVASDMIRDKTLVQKLDDDPSYFTNTYALSQAELSALRTRNLLELFHLGLHPFLLVRFAGMVGILEYWQALGAPGRRDQG
jgi:aromatic-ring opening dioxygenase LigAB LigA subunit